MKKMKLKIPNCFVRPYQAIVSLIFFLIVAIMDLNIEKNINKFLIILFVGWFFAMGLITVVNFLED